MELCLFVTLVKRGLEILSEHVNCLKTTPEESSSLFHLTAYSDLSTADVSALTDTRLKSKPKVDTLSVSLVTKTPLPSFQK